MEAAAQQRRTLNTLFYLDIIKTLMIDFIILRFLIGNDTVSFKLGQFVQGCC